MPSNGDYVIKIVAQTDTTSFQAALRPLQEVSKTLVNINKAQNVSGGGLVGASTSTATSGIGSMAAGVKAAAGGQSAGGVGSIFGPDAAKNLQAADSALLKILNNIKAISMAAPTAAQALQSMTISAQGPSTTATAAGNFQYAGAGGGGVGNNASTVAAGASGGNNNQPPNGGGGLGLTQSINMDGVGMMAARIGGLAIGGARSIVNEVQAGYSGPMGFAAEKNRAMSGIFGAAWGGDYNKMMALRQIYDNGNLGDTLGQTVSGSSWVSRQFGALGQAGSKILSNLPVVGGLFGGGTVAPGGALGGFTGSSQTSKVAGTLTEIMNQQEEANPLILRSAISKFSGDIGSRAYTQMVLGTGLGTFKRKGRFGEVESDLDTYNSLNAKLTEQGFSASQLAGTTASMRSQVGFAGAGQMADYVMRASVAGAGEVAGVMASAARAGGSAEAGMRFARTAMGGGIERFAGLDLGRAIAGSGFDPMGTTSGFGALGAFQGGFAALGQMTGGVADFNLAQRASLGLQFGSSIVGGGLDAYQRGRNLVEAMAINPGGDVYSQDYLAQGMNMKQMMDMARGGKLTTTAEMLGLSQKDIKNQLIASTGSMLDRWVDTGAQTPMARELRKIRESGQDWTAYVGGLKGKDKIQAGKAVTAFLGQETGQGEEATAGLVAGVVGLDTKTLRTGDISSGLRQGTAEADDAKRRADVMRKEGEELQAVLKQFRDAIKTSVPVGEQAARSGQNLNQRVDEVVAALGELVAAIDPASKTIFEARMKQAAKPEGTAHAAAKTLNNVSRALQTGGLSLLGQ